MTGSATLDFPDRCGGAGNQNQENASHLGMLGEMLPCRSEFRDHPRGRLAPCFPAYSATYNWGTIENHRFEVRQLDQMKQFCQKHCFSTLNHNLGYCYNDARVIRWLWKQAKRGFQGLTGSFD
jgi:hypothetical protein